MQHIDDDQRRARLAGRHGIAPSHRFHDPVEVVRAMTVLHATEAASVHLAVAARSGCCVADVDAALYDDRSLVKQLAMRRTLFVFPRDLLPAAWGSASSRVAQQEHGRISRDVVRSGIADDGDRWLARAGAAVLDFVRDGDRSTAEIREAVPEISGTVTVGSATSKWGGEVPVAPRVLTWLGARGLLVRGVNSGHWRLARARWTTVDDWLGEEPRPLTPEAGYAELVRRWLATFGPGTTKDIQWWLGSTATAARRALVDVAAVEVSLDGGATGWVLPDDLEPVDPVGDWAALLPVLDPTTMGWKQRDFYLRPQDTPFLFDSNGNAGTTAWWNGRIVGCWVQDDQGVVSVVPREPLSRAATSALATEADRLTAWLGGVRISSVYSSRQMKSARLP
ncbi:winged helix DNA-binding domain-containing protein [Nocardioides sp. JQ2195]|uniref:winged helix DNA-binding domain-containing protein n=1 Tax=Nocardioides sp. JQ2195 TaxID=2592334 RepID=UPI00143E9828|nr:winged helix DNA-binding domain-containing protein [Nocardioides sp. JQ2195]QIX26082.1 winged helix DNA-binding domain-containing protein [Nocardioides sp. JQ2195]